MARCRPSPRSPCRRLSPLGLKPRASGARTRSLRFLGPMRLWEPNHGRLDGMYALGDGRTYGGRCMGMGTCSIRIVNIWTDIIWIIPSTRSSSTRPLRSWTISHLAAGRGRDRDGRDGVLRLSSPPSPCVHLRPAPSSARCVSILVCSCHCCSLYASYSPPPYAQPSPPAHIHLIINPIHRSPPAFFVAGTACLPHCTLPRLYPHLSRPQSPSMRSSMPTLFPPALLHTHSLPLGCCLI